MTAMSPAFVFSDSQVSVAGTLIDALLEAVVLPPDGRTRAAVICSVVQEMCAAVEWLSSPDLSPDGQPTEDELAGLRDIAAAARDHRDRMILGG